jgi:hypothetical protein
VNNGSITDTVFHANLSLVKGHKSWVPYVVKESIIPWVAYPIVEYIYVSLKEKLNYFVKR